ncbi:MAG: class I SAM-dependent methyltransferase [Nanoarchaeota archaeon]
MTGGCIDAETEFFSGLIELQYGRKAVSKLKAIAGKLPWAKGWPADGRAFWNAEAFMWSRKIDKSRRDLISGEISKELLSLKKGKNLDIGCGAYSYVPSVGIDFSEKMLQFNDLCSEKVIGDLEKLLPFPDESFNSATAVFVLNYIRNYRQLLKEVCRVLKKKGVFVAVLSSAGVNNWQKQKEVNDFNKGEWKALLQKAVQKAGLATDFYEKEGLLFFKCRKGAVFS